MSLITRCPACMTMFRVVPDQLRISEGWVRCGQCDEVFDATAHMQDLNVPSSGPAPTDSQEMAQTPTTKSEPVPALPAKLAEDTQPRIEPTLDVTGELDLAYSVLHTHRSSDETVVSETWGQDLALSDDHAHATPSTAVPQPSFMRASQAELSQHRPWVRASLYFSLLLLSLGMIVQVLVHERDRIAALAPDLRPVVETVCDLLQCTVAPLRQIESIVMDSSSFNKLRNDVYRLNFTLKNTSQIALAMPAIELSLTDAQDQALMRRVIHPADLGILSDVLAAGSESSASLTLVAKIDDGLERVAGYRILAFYP
jgi:predicted Zn finger-like uncharacterized protein